MKTLYLLRHADAEKLNLNSDFNRIVSIKGIKEVEQLSIFLQKKNLYIDEVICSPAIRTKQTWEYLNDKLKFQIKVTFPDKLYNISVQDMVNLLQNISDQSNSVLLVGHNPTISQIANELLNNQPNTLSLGTCNIVCISFDVASWQEITDNPGKLEWLYSASNG